MSPLVLLIAVAAFCSTFLGGLFALRFRDKLHLILGFSAGAVLAVAFFDLLPEALELGAPYPASFITSLVGLGFVIYMVLDRLIVLHADQDPVHYHPRGNLGAASLLFHSYLDGLAIGLAFQVADATGLVVAMAVLTHDFSDGINTINLILKNRGTKREAMRWLVLDATAPVAGVATTFYAVVPAPMLGLMLAVFCGFFTYIGASDLLPESHHAHPTKWTTFMTILGLLVVYLAVRAAAQP
jgi:ZIP family zinc transporter